MIKIFRQKYMYNPQNPIYSSPTAKTYNCMNTQTKNKRLIIIEHLVPPPFIEPSPGILQPIQIPTTAQPFSVYPLCICCSEIQRVGEPEAMYVIKCLAQSKLKKYMYAVLSDQGICCSEVEGLLPEKSPDLLKIAISMLGLTDKLEPKENCVVSKQAINICKAINNNDSPTALLQNYGWKDDKKNKEALSDPQFWIFKGRRKQQSPFQQQYGLALHIKSANLCRVKVINLTRDGYQQHFYKQFTDLISYIQNSSQSKLFMKVLKLSKDARSIKIFTQIANQGALNDYINNKSQMGNTLTEKNFMNHLNSFVESMTKFAAEYKSEGIGSFHMKSLFVHNGKICFGEPVLITDTIEKKIRNNKNSMDYYAPEMKQNIILYQNLQKQTKQKMDIWSFGFVLHKILAKQIPVFDTTKKPIINKTKISVPMGTLITKCLDMYPVSRPQWKQINLKEIQKRTISIEQVRQQQPKRQEIKLGARNQKRSEKPSSPEKKYRIIQELNQQQVKKSKQKQSQQDNLQQKQQQLSQKMPIPQQVSSKLKKIKLILKIIIIMALYIFVFFRPFLWSSASIIQSRASYSSTSLHLVDQQGNRISSTTILTDKPKYFMDNTILFDQIQQKYQCIDNNFDPIYNPTYSLLSYIQSGGFLALLLTGWLMAIVICVTKAISIWKGGISNRPKTQQCRYWVSYGFYELTLAAVLFSHFYIYEFFYFASATPCLSISNFSGLQPFFDSSLYLFLSNQDGYFKQVFSTLGILSILLLLSSCFHAWGPKLDQKYISSIPSIFLRFVPFILLLLICRIGVFMLFSPTAINDTTKMLPKIVSNSFQGFIGIIPQMFILICVSIEVLIQLFMYWCQRKTAQSDRLARFFNIRKKKTVDGDMSRIENSMLEQSKQKLNASSIENI